LVEIGPEITVIAAGGTEVIAQDLCVVHTILVPLDDAAVGVLLADEGAAGLVFATGAIIRFAAIYISRAGVLEAWEIFAVFPGSFGTNIIPFHIAAIGIYGAYCIAA